MACRNCPRSDFDTSKIVLAPGRSLVSCDSMYCAQPVTGCTACSSTFRCTCRGQKDLNAKVRGNFKISFQPQTWAEDKIITRTGRALWGRGGGGKTTSSS